jgi:hypothetical protein
MIPTSEKNGGSRIEISFQNSIVAFVFPQWSTFLVIPYHWQADEN